MLTTVVGVVIALSLLAALAFRMCAETGLRPEFRTAWAADATAGFCVVVMLGFLAGRSLDFGVDTPAYAELLSGYCHGSSLEDQESSYLAAIFLINSGMAGACRVSLLPAVWAGLVVGILLLSQAPLRTRLRYAALLLVSMVGIELTTNALRQGLGVALLVVAVSYWPRYWFVSIVAALAAVSLHTSSLLVLLACGLAVLGWAGFLIGSVGAVALVIIGLQGNVDISLAEPLLYEISKYIEHEADEIYIRILAAGCMAAALVSPWLACRTQADRRNLYARWEMGVAARLSCTVIPFLFLPYFGYRYVYGIWPIVLWLTMRAVDNSGNGGSQTFHLECNPQYRNSAGMERRIFLHEGSPIPLVVSAVGAKPFGLSVVVPVFNRGDLLIGAIDSVIAPLHSPVEIVIVDDASTEDVRRQVSDVNSSGVPIRMVSLLKNAGPQSARNLGMRRARYRFVAFLDSDDRFVADKIPRLLEKLSANDVDLLFHSVIGMEKYASLARLWVRLRGVVPMTWFLAFCNPIVTPALVIRNDGRLGVPGMRYCEDYAFLLHYVRPGTRIVYVDRSLTVVDRAQGSPGGISEAVWKMRRGEFRARRVVLRSVTPEAVCRWCVGTFMGCLRIVNDVVRGRYFAGH